MKNNLIFTILFVCGCVSSTTTPIKQKQDISQNPLWQEKTDDIEWKVAPAWHNGKNFNLTQSLKANKIKKDKINVRKNGS